MKNKIKNELSILKAHMVQNKLAPSESVIPDNQRHRYVVDIDGEALPASYIATRKPVGNDGPLLICSYGFENAKEQYFYESPINNVSKGNPLVYQ